MITLWVVRTAVIFTTALCPFLTYTQQACDDLTAVNDDDDLTGLVSTNKRSCAARQQRFLPLLPNFNSTPLVPPNRLRAKQTKRPQQRNTNRGRRQKEKKHPHKHTRSIQSHRALCLIRNSTTVLKPPAAAICKGVSESLSLDSKSPPAVTYFRICSSSLSPTAWWISIASGIRSEASSSDISEPV